MALLALLSACSTDPNFAPPAVGIPAAYSAGPAAPAEQMASWWRRFDDPTLDRLVTQALKDNPDLLQAMARIRQSRAQQKIVKAQTGPSLNATGQAGYTRISENAIQALPGTGDPSDEPIFGLPGMDFTTFQAGFDASWEIDLFGGNRHEKSAAKARTDAVIWSARDIQVTIAAEVGKAYLNYRILQQRIDLADRQAASEREMLDFVAARVSNGLALSTDLKQQERQLAEASAGRETLVAERGIRLHALAFLLGEPPTVIAEQLAAPGDLPDTGFDVPPGLPSELLLRRADLRAAEQRLAAATSDIGVARAEMFPKISLTGALRLVSTSLASLLTPASIQAGTSAGLNLPIFDGGRLRATVELRRAQAEEAAQAYREQIYGALRDVEDALSRLDSDRNRQRRLAESQAAARDAADTIEVRYRNGLVSFLEVISARQTLLAAEDASAEASAVAASDIVALYKALGGGWDVNGDHDG